MVHMMALLQHRQPIVDGMGACKPAALKAYAA